MIDFKQGQLIVILSAYTDVEVYGTVNYLRSDSILLSVKPAGLLNKGWDILCLLLGSDEIFEFHSTVESIDGSSIMIRKPIETSMNSIEKRRFSRVEYEIGFVGRPLLINNVSVAKYGKTFIGKTINISAGGILAETNLCLPVNTVFSFKLKINYFVDCTAVVKRVTECPEGGKYHMGCQFIDMSLEDIKAISLFAFRERLKRRRMELYGNSFR